jgi:SNF2 family DNA or RNA helicase
MLYRRDDAILIKDLPPKTEYVVRFKMSLAQYKGYMTIIATATAGPSPLIALLVLRALCNHPKIFHSVRLAQKCTELFN